MDSDLNHHPCNGAVAAGSEKQTSYAALGFSSVRDLLKAGALIRDSGFSVIAVPRRVKDCGVLLLIESKQLSVIGSLLARNSLEPVEISTYPPGGEKGVSHDQQSEQDH